MESQALLGREPELAQLSKGIALVREGRGQALRISGEAGIGKSALLGAMIENVVGVRVIQTRALEAELGLPLAVIKDLVDPLAAFLPEVPPVQRAALEGAVARGPPTAGDRFAAYAGLVSLLAAAASDEPLVLVVDDVQWADRASNEALLYASRRIAQDPIAILLGQRLGEPAPLDLAEIDELRLAGLDAEAARVLLDEGPRQLSPEIVEQIVAHAHGNPLALQEIPDTLTDEQLAGAARLPIPIPGGARIEELFGRLLERELSAEDRHGVGVAALSMAGDPANVKAALDSLQLDQAALVRAESARILALSPSRIEFRHPLLRSAAAGALSPADARGAHLALADALADGDLIERAYHRVRAAEQKDEGLAQELEAAGGQSMARGAHAVAADLFARSVEVSEEPPAAIGRGGQAAMAAFLAGDLPGAKRSLERALAGNPPDPARAQLEHQLGSVTFYLGDTAGGLLQLERTGLRVADVTPEIAAVVLADAALYASIEADCRDALRLSTLARAAGTRSSDRAAAANAAAAHCHARLISGESAFAEIEEAASTLSGIATPGSTHALRLTLLGACATFDGHSAHGLAYMEPLIRQARASASVSAVPFALLWVGHANERRGQPDRALSLLGEGLGLAYESGQENVASLALALRSRVFAMRGSYAAANDDASRCLDIVGERNSTAVFAKTNRALVELVRGNHAGVVARLAPLNEWVWDECGMEHPGLVEPIAPLLVESQVALGQREAPASVTRRYWAQCERSESRLGWAYAARMEGLVKTIAGEPGDEDFRASVEHFDSLDDPLEKARSQLLYGEALAERPSRTAAIAQLLEARAGFAELEATPWHVRAEQALAHLGSQVDPQGDRDRPALTPHERQVADLVVDGLKNDEIAEQLFVTRRTVESHLTSVYRKFGIERRTQLSAALRRRR